MKLIKYCIILLVAGSAVQAKPYVTEGCEATLTVQNGRVYRPCMGRYNDDCSQSNLIDLNRKVVDIGGGKLAMQYKGRDGQDYSTVLCERSRARECGCRSNY